MRHDFIFTAIKEKGGNPYYVGGFVRDSIIGIESKDIDVEVFNITYEDLCIALSAFGEIDIVGKSFGVIKLKVDNIDYDFSLPRRERKVSDGHTGFDLEVDPTMTIVEAAARRDFTINAIYEDPFTGEIIDPFNGVTDILRTGLLRATSDRFKEDPLRVLRAVQFAGRFCLRLNFITGEMCKEVKKEYDFLSSERIRDQWYKWAVKSCLPSAGLKVLQQTHWIDLYEEIKDLVDLKQDLVWHPEGCVFTHTMHVCDAAAAIAERERLSERDKLILVLAALCHDLGKALTTKEIDGRWRAPGHDKAGIELTETLLASMGFEERVIEEVSVLVSMHMVHCGYKDKNGKICVTDRAVRRLARKLLPSNIRMLLFLIEADYSGRPPLTPGLPQPAIAIREVAERLGVLDGPAKKIITGRHLQDLGFCHSDSEMKGETIHFGRTIAEMYEKQLDGKFADESEGIDFLKSCLHSKRLY